MLFYNILKGMTDLKSGFIILLLIYGSFGVSLPFFLERERVD